MLLSHWTDSLTKILKNLEQDSTVVSDHREDVTWVCLLSKASGIQVLNDSGWRVIFQGLGQHGDRREIVLLAEIPGETSNLPMGKLSMCTSEPNATFGRIFMRCTKEIIAIVPPRRLMVFGYMCTEHTSFTEHEHSR